MIISLDLPSGLGQLSPAAVTEQWEQGFGELAIFRGANNHCRVSALYKTASGFALGPWVSRQRVGFNKDQLTPERIQRLGDLGFLWDAHAEKWEQGFSELAIFRDTNNHCLVPATYKTASGFALRDWVNNQRTGFNKDQLTPERIQRLDELGFVWRAR